MLKLSWMFWSVICPLLLSLQLMFPYLLLRLQEIAKNFASSFYNSPSFCSLPVAPVPTHDFQTITKRVFFASGSSLDSRIKAIPQGIQAPLWGHFHLVIFLMWAQISYLANNKHPFSPWTTTSLWNITHTIFRLSHACCPGLLNRKGLH